MKKRAILLAVASIFVMGLFAACSNDDNSDAYVTNLATENSYWYSLTGTYNGKKISDSDIYVKWTSNKQSNYTDYEVSGTFDYYNSGSQTVQLTFKIREINGKYLNMRDDYADVTSLFSGSIGGGSFGFYGVLDGSLADFTFTMK